MFTDTHCHLDHEYYNDLYEVLENAKQNGINRLIACGCSVASNAEVIDIINKYDNVYATIGFHPDQADIINDNDIVFLEEQIQNHKILGIGEIGLDYHYDGIDKEKQKDLFIKQLKLAEKVDKPVVIHSRDAVQDTIDILKKFNIKGVIHSFSGSYEVAKIYINMGFKLGINGVVTFKNSNLKDTLIKLSPENLVIETDSPYLTPHPYRGEKNEPKNIKIIADFLCELYDLSFEELAEITNKNIKSIFDIWVLIC